jgi:hypothetical protein
MINSAVNETGRQAIVWVEHYQIHHLMQ